MDAWIAADAEDLEEHIAAWDELAVLNALPYCSPHWMLAWWRERRPEGAALRVVVVVDSSRLVGVLPFYREATPRRLSVWRQLCAGFCTRVGPIAVPGEEAAVAAAAAPLLARREGPDILALEGLHVGRPWPALLRAEWPGRLPPLVRSDLSMGVPVALVEHGFDDWLGRRGPSVRRETRRRRRRLDERGASIRVAGPDELETAVGTLCELYRARWATRGGSDRLSRRLEPMLLKAGRDLGDRFQLWLLECDGAAIGAHLYVAAGGELSAFGGGFRADWRRYAPTLVLRLAAVEHAAATRMARVELGEGAQPEKLEFSDTEDRVEWVTILPRGRQYVPVRLYLLPKHARWLLRRVFRSLPLPLQTRLRRIRAAVRGA